MSDGEHLAARHGEPDRRAVRRENRDGSSVDDAGWRLFGEGELPSRLRRLRRMESTARVWVNGRELNPRRGLSHLSESYE
jgi:hypothetical protein